MNLTVELSLIPVVCVLTGTPSVPQSGEDEDTAEDYYTEEKASTGKKRRGRKPRAVEEVADEEEANDGEFGEERPKRKRASKKSKKVLDAEGRYSTFLC